MKHVLTIVTMSLLAACGGAPGTDNTSESNSITMTESRKAMITYPKTTKGDVVDSYFETQIADPYRWLEDDRSSDTESWVKAQNKVTFSYLEQIPYREQIKQKLAASWNYEKVSAPFKEGKYSYFYKNDGLQNQYVLYRQLADGSSEVFLDPNTFSEDGTTSLAEVSFSIDGSKLAYSISVGRSDWRIIFVIVVETKHC